MKKNRVYLRLIALSLSASIVGCGDGSAVETDTSAADVQETTTVADTRDTMYDDSLPDNLDYTGKTYRIYNSTYAAPTSIYYHTVLSHEDYVGEIVNDAVYERNLAVMDRFGITIEETNILYSEALGQVRAMVNAGDDTYDLMSLTDRHAMTVATEGLICPIGEMKYVDLSKPYWAQTINERMSIGGRNVLAVSDLSLRSYGLVHVLLFNKDMVEAFKLEDPYSLIRSGQWTGETFYELCTAVSTDLNGDTTWDDDDRYGFLGIIKQISPNFWIGGGCESITKDADDIPVYTMNSERMLSVLEYAYNLTWGDTVWYHTTYNGNNIQDPPIFADSRALFSGVRWDSLDQAYYRDLTFDYGIIPYPKYDEDQKDYYTRVEGGINIYFAPTTAPDPDFSGAILEALSSESAKHVVPSYYEVALKVKYTRDDESVQILDEMMSHRIYDLGDTLWCDSIRDNFVFRIFTSGKQILASDIEAQRSAVEASIANVVKQFAALD